MARGDGRCFQRGGRWWIAYYAKKAGCSEEVREPAGKTEKEARKKLKNRLKELAAQSLGVYICAGPEADRITIEDLLHNHEEWSRLNGKELKRLHSHMKPLRAYFGYERAVGVDALHIQRYIAHRHGQKVANATINREVGILQRAFTLAAGQKLLSQFHVPACPDLPEEDAIREGFAEKADIDAVLSFVKNPDVKDFILWGYMSGMRRGEIVKLTWAAFDRETSTLTLPSRSTKTKKPRKLVLIGIFREIIARRLSLRRLDCPLIFHRMGKAIGSFRKAWKNACAKAGISSLLFHDLRRSAVRNLIRSGVSKTVAKQISGHRTDAVFDRYNITSDEDIQDAQEKLERYITALPAKSNLVPIAQPL